jgi:hypothetical protein
MYVDERAKSRPTAANCHKCASLIERVKASKEKINRETRSGETATGGEEKALYKAWSEYKPSWKHLVDTVAQHPGTKETDDIYVGLVGQYLEFKGTT